MSDKLVVEDLYKIFGPRPHRALELMEQGLDKDAIFARTGNTVGVREASFSIREGEVFVIMGLSGSGKSTMVRMFNRLIEPTAGHLYVNGEDITRMSRRQLIDLRRRDMSMVFQSFALLPHKTVIENASLGLDVSGFDRARQHERALQALEAVGLGAHANSYPDELSGGMQQRVGLARALATDPTILLMDEAFSALDPLIRTEMQDELMRLQQEKSRTVVFISHDLDEAMRIGDRIAIMQGGQVVQIGTPQEIVSNPANDYVRSFFYGVDVSQVYSAGDIARHDAMPLLQTGQADAAGARQQLGADGCAVLLDESDGFRGLVSARSLADAADLDAARIDGIDTVEASTAMSDVLGRAAASDWPLVVVEDGRFIGTLSQRDLLQTLDRTHQ
ncbi:MULTISPECIES: glycine betaine/L-proline ABC transporter ATP-binding protein ProV [unclassified Thioalkalivibrio]|uniref:glycine betaine/L-proline ABC transporter ATP-binding protein ProV n=1 Tax=unclassified Thioalkalivibrio TaxID=2621013 RepID=UPI00037B048B|nr:MULTISPECIES: glycine betaine/L-proline ABC transporter ATP-binding protein ProV [unclassified Thioalkalivibrio]